MARVLVLGAAGPAGMNYVRAIEQNGHQAVPADTDELRMRGWYGEYGEVSPTGRLDFDWLEDVVRRRHIDVVHSQPEGYVLDLVRERPDFVRHHLPPEHDVVTCMDKWETAIRWRRDGIRNDFVHRIEHIEELKKAGDWLGYPYWLRATVGAGARGATKVDSPEMGFHWMAYWKSRYVDWEWIAEEYLPGRDYAWTSIWHEGRLVCSTARERLQYIYPHLAPSGRTGTPVVAEIVHSEAVNVMASEAVMSVSREPHGVYCVDLREDRGGTPRPTEINCGRFFTTSYHTAAMGVNFPAIHVDLAMREDPPDLPEFDVLEEGLVWLRHIDCDGVVVHERVREPQ